MSGSIFSVPLFFILFRETLEASIIISVLLSLVENLVERSGSTPETSVTETVEDGEETREQRKKRLIKRMRIQIWAGAATGLLISICIGAAFIAVFFTTLSDIWAKSEEVWEGTFSIVACVIIFVMGLTMLRIDRSKVKWRAKLEAAFDKKPETSEGPVEKASGGKWTLFLLPLITVLREGLEAVVFVGGVSLGQPARSIPLAAIVGIISGLIVGYLIYASSSRVNLSIFLVVSTNVLFLLGAGLFSKGVGNFQMYFFGLAVGGDVGELATGPGSYDTRGSVWSLPYGNPANVDSDQGWTVFNAVLGWNNNASIGTILAYVFYWLAVFVALVYMKWSEGRVTLFGFKSAATKRRELKAATKAEQADEQKSIDSGDEKRGAALNSSGSEGSFEEKVPVDTTAPQSTKATELV